MMMMMMMMMMNTMMLDNLTLICSAANDGYDNQAVQTMSWILHLLSLNLIQAVD